MPIRIVKKDEDTNREKGLKKSKMLVGGQAKLDKNKNNRIDAQDFKILRKEKAKGRGMGLQDEKVKPGKVMKANKGGTFSGYSKVFETAAKAGQKNTGTSTITGVKPNPKKSVAKAKRFTYKSMDEMRQKTLGYKPGESTEAFKKRIAKENFAKRAATATGARGKIALGIAGAGVAAYNYLKSKIQKKEDKNKKTLRDFRDRKKPGIPSKKTQLINKALDGKNKFKFEKKMGGGMMQRYAEGGPTEKSKLAQQARRAGQRKPKPGALGRAGKRLGELGGSGKDPKPKMKVVIIGGSKNSLTGQGGLERDAENKPYRYSYSTDPMLKGATIIKGSSLMGGGMMNKPMGYKSGKSIKVKCKLGKNKPTKMY